MPITLISWNIWYKEKPENILTFLKENKADIFCLQELTQNLKLHNGLDVPKYLAKGLDYNYHFVVANAWENETLGNGIFTKFPIKQKRHVYLSERNDNSDDFSKEGRVFVEADIDVGNNIIKVGTTHLSYTHKFIETPEKNMETDNLVKELGDDIDIFCGDLNATPDSYAIKCIAERLHHSGPNFSEKSWTTKPFSYQGFEETELNWRLDYIFNSKRIKVAGANILKTNSSDHLPLKVVFDIK